MRARREGAVGRNVRAGSAQRSPYLLSGLLVCGRCGHNYQGRTINSTKCRKDGTKIQTLYYACGGHVMKGNAACEKFLLRKDPLEDVVLATIQGRLGALLAGDGERLLRQYIEEEIAAQGPNPHHEAAELETRIGQIDRQAAMLLEGVSPETKGFIDSKLRDLAAEKERIQKHVETLQAARHATIDPDIVLREGLASLRDLPHLLESGSLKERKEFVRAFIDGITVVPDEARLELRVRTFPGTWSGNSSVGVVAGARYERVQMELEATNCLAVPCRHKRVAA